MRIGLALKTGKRLRIASHLFRQELERNETMQPGVLGLVNHTHGAAELLHDAVVRNSLGRGSAK